MVYYTFEGMMVMQELKIEDSTLATTVEIMIKKHLESMDKECILNLYDLLLEQIEPPLLKAVIERCRYNQSLAAKMLGVSRGTLRTKLTKYFDDQYCGSQDKN